jgi:DNA-binding NarL/FixJ family response regulator
MPIRVILADEDPAVLQAMNDLLTDTADIEVVEMCTNGESALGAARRHFPDVLVVDLALRNIPALTVARVLRDEMPSLKVALVASTLSDQKVIDGIRAGVRGILLKEFVPKMLAACVRKVNAGEAWLEIQSAARALELLVQQTSAPEETPAEAAARVLAQVR